MALSVGALRFVFCHGPEAQMKKVTGIGGIFFNAKDPGSADGDYFAPSKSAFMINYRVEDLHGVLRALRSEACNVLEKVDDAEYGKFGWVMDPEGNKVELWQPPEGQ
jgi:predicted enzyme related to lactoylglutathione lyase